MENLLYIVVVFILVDLFFAYIIFFRRKKISKSDIKIVKTQIAKIKKNNNPQMVIMEMDKIIDNVLGKLGFKGGLANKLRKAKDFFSDYNGIWTAHKIRNRVAHEVGFRVSRDAYKKALNQYERAFRDLGIK